MKKLIYITAVPQSLQSFVLPRMEWLTEEYEVVGICSPGASAPTASTPTQVGTEIEELRAGGMRIIEVPIARHISPWQDIKSLIRLWWVLRKEKPDMVHSMTPKAGLLGMTAAWLAGVKVRMHTFTGLIFPWRKGLLRRILWATDALTCAFATIVNPEGKGVRKQLEEGKVTRKKMHIIANGNINGVDLTRFTPGAGREEMCNKLGFEAQHVVFTFVGRLVSDKGVPELVDSFVRLHAEHPEARLILIGSEEPELDPLPEATKKLMHAHPAILCPGSQRNIPEWLAATDVYTLPSHREGFCNSLLEAGAMALPSITYDICGCNDSVDNETGILVPPYDEEALYTAMKQLLIDPARRQQLGQAARKRMEERFDRRYVWQELKAFYRKSLKC